MYAVYKLLREEKNLLERKCLDSINENNASNVCLVKKISILKKRADFYKNRSVMFFASMTPFTNKQR